MTAIKFSPQWVKNSCYTLTRQHILPPPVASPTSYFSCQPRARTTVHQAPCSQGSAAQHVHDNVAMGKTPARWPPGPSAPLGRAWADSGNVDIMWGQWGPRGADGWLSDSPRNGRQKGLKIESHQLSCNYINSLAQDCGNSSALSQDLPQSCVKSSIYIPVH